MGSGNFHIGKIGIFQCKEARCKTLGYGGEKGIQKTPMTFFPVKAEIEEKKNIEISTGNPSEISSNTPKSPDFKENCTIFNEISNLKIDVVEISGGKKDLRFEKFGSRGCVLHLESISLLKNSILWPQAKLANICVFQRKYENTGILTFPLKNEDIRQLRLKPQQRVLEL